MGSCNPAAPGNRWHDGVFFSNRSKGIDATLKFGPDDRLGAIPLSDLHNAFGLQYRHPSGTSRAGGGSVYLAWTDGHRVRARKFALGIGKWTGKLAKGQVIPVAIEWMPKS